MPGDGVRRELVALELDEELRARPDDLEAGNAGEEEVRRRVDPPQAPIQSDAVELPARGGIDRQVERLPAREHDLDRLARRDRVLRDLDRMHVLVAAEARLDGGRRGGPASPPSRSAPDPDGPDTTPPVPASSAADGREVRSRASKMAASAIR